MHVSNLSVSVWTLVLSWLVSVLKVVVGPLVTGVTQTSLAFSTSANYLSCWKRKRLRGFVFCD